MTIKHRIRQLEQAGKQQRPLIGGRTQAEWKRMRAERMRRLQDPEALDRIRQQAMREDALSAPTTAGCKAREPLIE